MYMASCLPSELYPSPLRTAVLVGQFGNGARFISRSNDLQEPHANMGANECCRISLIGSPEAVPPSRFYCLPRALRSTREAALPFAVVSATCFRAADAARGRLPNELVLWICCV